jgi:RNA polymerase sigma-B factor
VIEQNLPLARALARRFSRPSEPLDELVQVAAIGLIKAVDRFDDERGRDLGAYAVPTIVGELRRHVRQRGATFATTEVDADTLDGGAPSQAETSEARELVRAALRSLGPRERRIVALRFYRDWSQQTIAAEVGLSQVQVSRVLTSSLAKMRETLEAS